MKFYIVAAALLMVVLAAIAVLTDTNNVSVPATSSGSDDASMKTLKIE